MINSIVIILGDNDFGHTFRQLLTTIKRSLDCNYGGKDLTEKQVTELIDMGIKFHYAAFQNFYQYKDKETFSMHFNHVDAFLKGFQVLFNEQADQSYQTEDHNHGAWHLHVPSGQINSF